MSQQVKPEGKWIIIYQSPIMVPGAMYNTQVCGMQIMERVLKTEGIDLPTIGVARAEAKQLWSEGYLPVRSADPEDDRVRDISYIAHPPRLVFEVPFLISSPKTKR